MPQVLALLPAVLLLSPGGVSAFLQKKVDTSATPEMTEASANGGQDTGASTNIRQFGKYRHI